MARRGASSARRIEINRAALDAITLAAADGLFALAKEIIADAGVPDAAPYGVGLVEGGGVLAYAGSKKVGQFSTGNPTAVKKPRAAGRLKAGSVTVIAGYGFPARFVEEGTARMRARPFLTPALMRRLPDAGPYIADAMRRHQITSATRRAAGDVYGGRSMEQAMRQSTLDVMAKVGQAPMPGLG